jgi:hypothetical protein
MTSEPTLDRSTSTVHASATWSVPWRRLVGVSLVIGWLPIAIGEALYGTMDDFSQLDLLAASPGRMIGGGLVQFFGAIVLVPAILGMILLARSRARMLTTIGGVIAIGLPVGLGAFSQLHLVAREFARPGLDQVAMTEFVAGFNEVGGGWMVPIMLVLLGMSLGLPLLALALRRARVISVLPVVLVIAGAAVHLLMDAVLVLSWTEVASHFVLAAGVSLIGFRVLRMTGVEWSAAITSADEHASVRERRPVTHSRRG